MVPWKGKCRDCVSLCQLLNNRPHLKGDEELMEATLMYLCGLKSQRLKQSRDSWRHHGVCRLCRSFRNIRCQVCARYIGATQRTTMRGSSRALDVLKCGKEGWRA